ncbi:hypothetical protein LXL04_024060 [Taraxacum kok-saghyz]
MEHMELEVHNCRSRTGLGRFRNDQESALQTLRCFDWGVKGFPSLEVTFAFGFSWWGFGVMGCTPSKQSVCRNCNAQCSPVRRSYSSDAHRSPPHVGDHRHVVALTSTTLGFLHLDSSKPNMVCHDTVLSQIFQEPVRQILPEKNSEDFSENENMTKISPEIPIRTQRSEPETINTWELMEGLDDSSPLRPPSTANHIRCFSFNVHSDSIPQVNHRDSNTNSNSTSIASDFDPNAINIKPLIIDKEQSSECNLDDMKKVLQDAKTEIMSSHKDKVILYFTSLRGVRKTYEDCCYVRDILKNSGVRVDERDVSMHSGFREELKELLGERYASGGLPKVFIGKKYIGGVEEIRRFHDNFQLDKVLESCEMVIHGGGGGGGCEACGDVRFLPCETCSGSCKIYYEVNSDDCEKEDEENDCGFQRCPDCNENGLHSVIKVLGWGSNSLSPSPNTSPTIAELLQPGSPSPSLVFAFAKSLRFQRGRLRLQRLIRDSISIKSHKHLILKMGVNAP